MDEAQAQLIMMSAAIFSLLVAGIPLAMYLRTRHKLATWVPVEAQVTDSWKGSQQSGNGASTTVLRVRYSFTTAEGASCEGVGQTHEEQQPGDRIEIRYDPQNPRKSQAAFPRPIFWYVIGIPWTVVFLGMAGLMMADALWGIMSR